jgi:Gram-negative bacterial TonB protein C-terminal
MAFNTSSLSPKTGRCLLEKIMNSRIFARPVKQVIRLRVGTTIDTEGHPRDIRVKVGLPYGMTQQADEAVKEWRLKPAIGPDGKPAAFRATIEMAFRLY